jgi:hypothetical protein
MHRQGWAKGKATRMGRRQFLLSMGAAVSIPQGRGLTSALLEAGSGSEASALVSVALSSSSHADLIAIGETGSALLEEAQYPWEAWTANQYRRVSASDVEAIAPRALFSRQIPAERLVILAGDLADAEQLPWVIEIAEVARKAGHVVIGAPAASSLASEAFRTNLDLLAEQLDGLIYGLGCDLPPDEINDLDLRKLVLSIDLDGLRIALENFDARGIARKLSKEHGYYVSQRSIQPWPSRSDAQANAEQMLRAHLSAGNHEELVPLLLSVSLSARVPKSAEPVFLRELKRAALPARPMIAFNWNTDLVRDIPQVSISSLSARG